MMQHPLIGRLAALLVCSATATSLALAEPAKLEVEHTQGTITILAPPSRVAVFDSASLDTLQALEVDVAGVAKGSWPAYLKDYAEAPGRTSVGTLFEPDYDALKELKPDLIIIAGRSSSKYESLLEIAPTIDLSIDSKNFVEGVRSNLKLLGQIFDRKSKAAELDAELVTALDAVRTVGAQAGSALTVFTVGDSVIVHGPGERFGMIHEVTGMPSTAAPAGPAATGPRPEAGSPEALARRAQMDERLAKSLAPEPHWLFVVDRSGATGDQKGKGPEILAGNERVAASKAWNDKRVFYVDAPAWYVTTGGYLSLLNGARDMHKALSAAQ